MSSASKETDSAFISQIERDGFAVVPGVFNPVEVGAITTELTHALVIGRSGVLEQAGRVYAARNVLQLWPKVADVWRRSPLQESLSEILGPQFGLVRVLFLDKRPEQNWSLPWHKDLTIAVRNNRLPSRQFEHPTTNQAFPTSRPAKPCLREC